MGKIGIEHRGTTFWFDSPGLPRDGYEMAKVLEQMAEAFPKRRATWTDDQKSLDNLSGLCSL